MGWVIGKGGVGRVIEGLKGKQRLGLAEREERETGEREGKPWAMLWLSYGLFQQRVYLTNPTLLSDLQLLKNIYIYIFIIFCIYYLI